MKLKDVLLGCGTRLSMGLRELGTDYVPFRRLLLRAFVALVLTLPVLARANAQVSGAIYTTLYDGTTVNANVFDNCEDVYLNGGPQNPNGRGLPPGDYYFQVTDPSGKVLLSNDALANRILHVNPDGRIHNVPNPYPAPGTPHNVGADNGANGGQGVQLWPFDETPNGGGVYKVWITKVSDYVAGEGYFGFIESQSKTDNFKCVHDGGNPLLGNATVVILKYRDLNGNGQRDDNEPAMDGVSFVVNFYDKNGDLITPNDPANPVTTGILGDGEGTGSVTVASAQIDRSLFPVSYTVVESVPGGYVQTQGTPSGSIVDPDGFDIATFGNAKLLSICGFKYHDLNGNGVYDSDTESGIAGFEFTVTVTPASGVGGGPTQYSATSGEDGTWCLKDSDGNLRTFAEGATVSVVEVQKGGNWVQTQPSGGAGYSDVVLADGVDLGFVFGNVRYFSISGLKYHDQNGNGTRDEGEPTLPGFDFTVTVNGVETTVTSGSDGTWTAGPFLEGSTYSVVEVQKGAPWQQTEPSGNGGYSGTLGGDVSGLVFGNARYFTISGSKYYDSNVNGQQDPGEPAVPGINFTVTVNGVSTTVTSGSDGMWTAGPFLEGSTWSVVEGSNPGWIQTEPSGNGGYSGTLANNVAGLVFGNIKLGAGGGLTIGYWSNRNGQAAMTNQGGGMDANLAFLRGLCLRTGSGGDFDPATYNAFKNWLLGATATNMSYMLSAQLAAMELNVKLSPVKNASGNVVGGVVGTSLIYAPGTISANALGFATVNAVMAEANTFLCDHGLVLDGNPLRSYAEALKNALDKANNNLNFVLPYP